MDIRLCVSYQLFMVGIEVTQNNGQIADMDARKHVNTMDFPADPSMPIEDKIAIVGIGCRFANRTNGVYKFWDTLVKGMDCTAPIAPDRFDESFFLCPGEKRPGKIYNVSGGYLTEHPELFDRQFFKMTPDEANHMDPQIRLLLEVVWETLQDAGICAQSVRGSNTGVYMGVTATEYSVMISLPYDNINSYSNTGTNSCMVSNRISYEYDFHGPSLTVNTACSSSLYGILLACDGIRKGQCDMAVAGGVNINLTPIASVGFCQGGVVSHDGKSKTFDKSADGFARGEGVGVVVLKSLQRAIEDGDRIYSVIRGGALSNDGRTSGIARPSYDAQVALLEKAYDDAKVNPADITVLEAHGTGTKVGDTMEANAIGEVMGSKRSPDQHPLYVGSAKANYGHTEAAAGVAGVIKLSLCLQHEQIPKQVHFVSWKDNVDNVNLNIRVPTELTAWPEGAKRLVGCSAFGFGGANAHIVLEGYEKAQVAQKDIVAETSAILFLSAATKDALGSYLQDWEKFLAEMIRDNEVLYKNALYTAGVRSTHLEHRMCIITTSPRDAKKQIQLKLNQDAKAIATVTEGRARDGNLSVHRLVFVYSGMGSQWWGMARRLMIDDSGFRKVIENIDKILIKCGTKWSLTHMLTAEEDQKKMEETDIAQPCLCAVQIGLTEFFRSRGITPDAIVGHSVGEVAAAHAAGYFTLEEAVHLIYTRGCQLKKTSGQGTMVAILHDVEEVEERLKNSNYGNEIDVAAINGPRQIVVSGNTEALDAFTGQLRDEGVRCIKLKVNNAFHSFQQEKIRKPFLAKLKHLNSTAGKHSARTTPKVPLVSTVTGKTLDQNDVSSASYWWKNIRSPVKFMGAVEKLLRDGYDCFLEIGPHPVLSSSIKDTVRSSSSNSSVVVTGSLQRPSDTNTHANDMLHLLRSISRLHVEGYPIEHMHLFQDPPYEVVSIPTYPWQHELCSGTTQKAEKLFLFPVKCHPLLGKRLLVSHLSDETALKIWRSEYSQVSHPWLRDHKLQGTVIVPAATYVETMLAATREIYPDMNLITVKDLKFEKFIFAPDKQPIEVSLESGMREALFTLRSFNYTENTWNVNSLAVVDVTSEISNCIQPLQEVSKSVRLSEEALKKKYPLKVGQVEFYDELCQRGFHLGEAFRGIDRVHFSHDYREAVVYVSVPEVILRDCQHFNFHPALFDCIFQAFGGSELLRQTAIARERNTPLTFPFKVPHSVEKMQVMGKAPTKMIIHLHTSDVHGVTSGEAVVADAATKQVFARIHNMTFATVNNESVGKVQLWSREWCPIPGSSMEEESNGSTDSTSNINEVKTGVSGSVVIVKDKLGICAELIQRLEAEKIIVFDPWNSDDLERDFGELLQTLTELNHVIMLSALDVHQFDSIDCIGKDQFSDAQQAIGLLPVSLYRVLASLSSETKPKFWIITSGANSVVEDDLCHPLMAPTSSLSLTIMQEDPEFNLMTVDLPSSQDSTEAALWLSQFMKTPAIAENNVALRRKNDRESSGTSIPFDVHGQRIEVHSMSNFTTPTKSSRCRINLSKTISKKRLVVEQTEKLPDDANDVEILVKVLAFCVQQVEHDPVKCGYLFAGEITRSNERSEYGQGEIVIGSRTDEYLPTTISARVSEVIPVPVNITPVKAVNIVKEYFPCFLALQNALKSTAKSTVIVCIESEHDHVGIAATKMALEKGTSVYVHSNSDKAILERQGFLGEKHVIQVSDGNLDIHVNNLSADVLILSGEIHLDRRSFSALACKLRPFGTIIQVRGTTSGVMKMTQVPSNVNFVACDSHFGQLSGLEDAISTLLNLFNIPNGGGVQVQPACLSSPLSKLSQLPASLENVTVFIDVDMIPASLNFETTTFKANPDASYLVTGGSKGFGLALVEWLARCGARHIYALSRNSPTDETSRRYKVLHDIGVQITHLSADIGSPHDVETALLTIKEDGDHQLEGIFHAATKYSDAYLHNLTREIWDDVMMSKGYGALLLHQLTMKLNFPLKYFVLVSSIAEMIGNRGQGNYSATNRFVSSLCMMRRNLGLPATALLPGVINSEGFAAREGLVEMWMKLGLVSLSPSEILEVLEGILSSDYTVIGIVGLFDGLQFSKAFHVMISSHFAHPDGAFSILKSLVPPEANAQQGERDLVRKIKRESPEEAKSLISTSLAAILSSTLGYREEISQEATLVSLGLDSHLSSDLSNAIYEQFGVTMSAMAFLNDTLTFRALTEATYTRIMSAEGNREENAMISPTQTLQDELWLDVDDNVDTPSSQLICFPSVGEGPTMFAAWRRQLADRNIQMITVQMPGWERREQEKPLQNLTDIVKKLADLILPTLIRGRFAFFGHSIGGLIAFELAHYLKENYNLSPAHLFVSSWFSPTLEYPRPDDLKQNGHTYRKMQRIVNNHVDSSRPPTANGNSFKFSFFEPSTFSAARRKNALIPSIQAAITMCKKYRHVHKDKLHCSLTVLGGKDDDFISPNLLDDWRKEIHPSARFQKILLPGKHMYILSASKPVLKEIMAVMKKSENGSQNKQKRPLSRFWQQ
ncbi:phenolphthiocerol/phthiocerol polyketide synthase subunit C-like [Diadema antillarum]|uniref:phenolphthiocerol/phthiocerol polyketide synthase subunit C-like n=1 Tax=Diadema antillarum TaxID=105358 RepID=UPI003A87CC15